MQLTFYPIADSYLLVAVLAGLLMTLLGLAPRGRTLSRGRRAALTALRFGVIVLIILAMLRPTLVRTEVRKQSATLAVLVDQSRSMTVPDGIGGKTRWEVLRGAIEEAEPALGKLAEDFELRAYAFDADAQSLETEGGRIALPESPEGGETALGHALQEVLRREEGKRLLGVVLLSDGAQRAYAPRDLPPQTVAAQMRRRGYPLLTVPLGQSRGLGQAQDVAVKELSVNESVFVKNELAIGARVRVDGFGGREIPVRVLFESMPGKMEPVAQQNLRVMADGQLAPIEFSYAPQVPGEYKLTVAAIDQPGELVTTNNRLSTFVNVISGGLSVLYLEGSLRVEQKFLRRGLDASPDINVDYLRLDPRRPETRPGDFAERLAPGKYDVYILGDLDASIFREGELQRLADTIDRGAGLIMLGGFHSFGPGGYATTPLANVLPVEMNRFERQNLGEPIREDLHWPGPLSMEPTRFGLLHFALMLAGDRDSNLELWSKLPPLEGANRFGGTSAGALVLAEGQTPDGRRVPLLAAQQFGGGRVLAFAGDSTWRWWMKGFDSAHKRFWRQVVLWLARKDQSTEGNVWVRLAKRRFAPTARVDFVVGAQSPTGESVEEAEFEVEVVLPDGSRQSVQTVRQEGQTVGSFSDTSAAGDYAIEVRARKSAQLLGSARARFLVFEQDLELDNPAADVAVLESLASMTGGRSLAPEQLPGLIEELSEQTEHLEVEEVTKKTLWDRWPFFLALVGLLGLEWYFRKRWGLV